MVVAAAAVVVEVVVVCKEEVLLTETGLNGTWGTCGPENLERKMLAVFYLHSSATLKCSENMNVTILLLFL